MRGWRGCSSLTASPRNSGAEGRGWLLGRGMTFAAFSARPRRAATDLPPEVALAMVYAA